MSSLIPKLKRGAVYFLVSLGLISGQSWALTAAEIAAARTAAQAEGTNYGNAARTGAGAADPRTGKTSTLTAIKPETLINTGATIGPSNVWGTEYTGIVPSSLTDKSSSASLISVGNSARGASVSGFTQYNNIRADQANQSNNFLSRGPVVKPSISPTEPWIAAAHVSMASTPLIDRVCQPTPPADTPAKTSENTCNETYVPYIVPCTSQGIGVDFELIPAPVIAADISSYSCPASSGNTMVFLSGNKCVSTTTTVSSATTNFTCPASAIRSGSQCTLTTTSTYPAKINYSCAAGTTLNGTSCVKTTTTTQPPVTNYGCSTGQVLSGSNCVSISSQSATVSYSCISGRLNGSTCTTVSTSEAINRPSCEAYGPKYTLLTSKVLNQSGFPGFPESSCILNEYVYLWDPQEVIVHPPYIMYNWASNDPESVAYDPPTVGRGDWVYVASYYVYGDKPHAGWFAPIVATCPAGSTLSGTTCKSVSNIPASIAYTCPSTYTTSGSTCTKTSTTPATQTYSCSPGYTFNGSVCTQSTSSSNPATVSYSCPAGGILSGSKCNVSNVATTIATISYSCPASAVLSGSTCITKSVTTAAATVNYSCPTGYTLSGTQCTGKTSDKLVQTSSNGCGSLEGLSN